MTAKRTHADAVHFPDKADVCADGPGAGKLASLHEVTSGALTIWACR